MPTNRARETGHGIGFALVALGLAVAAGGGGRPFPAGFALAMAVVGLIVVAWAAGRRSLPGVPVASRRHPAAWSHDRAVGFFAGAAVFWALFIVAGTSDSVGVPPASDEPLAPPAAEPGLEAVQSVHHTFQLDPGRYVALGAPSTSEGPAWPAPAGTLGVEGTTAWNSTTGLATLHVTLEGDGGDGWKAIGSWTVGPDGAFNATVTAPEGHVRLVVRPDSSNPVFQPVSIQATLTFLAKA